jgi:hypothetical protein
MPSKNFEQIKIWKSAYKWLKHLSIEQKAKGVSSASMASLASQAILAIPDGNKPNPCAEEGEKQP